MLTDARGVPLGVAVAGANRHDVMLLEATLASIPVARPRPTTRKPQGVCLDRGYDITWVYRLLVDAGSTPDMRRIREDVTARRRGTRARRWVVERTHSWINRFRALLVRWAKETTNDEGSLHLACAYITCAYITCARAGLKGTSCRPPPQLPGQFTAGSCGAVQGAVVDGRGDVRARSPEAVIARQPVPEPVAPACRRRAAS